VICPQRQEPVFNLREINNHARWRREIRKIHFICLPCICLLVVRFTRNWLAHRRLDQGPGFPIPPVLNPGLANPENEDWEGEGEQKSGICSGPPIEQLHRRCEEFAPI